MITYNIIFLILGALEFVFGIKWLTIFFVTTILLFNLRYSAIVFPAPTMMFIDILFIVGYGIVLFSIIKHVTSRDIIGLGLILIKDIIYLINSKTKVYVKVERRTKINER